MCIIIYKPKGSQVDKTTLKRCYKKNPDGAGYMFFDKHTHISKGFFSFKSFWKAYQFDLELHGGSDFVLHFRIASSGNIDSDNTHPFITRQKYGLCHNGILSSIVVPKDSKVSDTQLFIEQVINNLPNDWISNFAMKYLISQYAENELSKFVVMDDKGRVTIFNETAGIWDNGCWFSNFGYQEPKKYTLTSKQSKDGFRYEDTYEHVKDYPKFVECSGCGGWEIEDECEVDKYGNFFCPTCAEENFYCEFKGKLK